jgi:hypothetical protein
MVVSTSSTTATGYHSLPKGGFDKLNHRDELSHVSRGGFDKLNHRDGSSLTAAWWFRQAQPPQQASLITTENECICKQS